MSEPLGGPLPYRVSYSGRVRDELERLSVRAKVRGMEYLLLDTLQRIDYRLRVYPQFGQPLRDLSFAPAQIWIATVPPLVVRYVIYEELRAVMVVEPFVPLRGSGLEP